MKTPVCVFAKPPVAGRVKTRLAASLGDAAAVSLASAMLCDVWETVTVVAGALAILATTEAGEFPQPMAEAPIWLQGDGDLGSRMERIAQRGIREAGRVILLGADSPGLKPWHLEEALHALVTHDSVIGPSFDGGYYLLGLVRCPDGLLQNLPWSTPETCTMTEQRLRSLQFSIGRLPVVGDIDVLADLAVCADPGPHTRAWMDEWLA